KNAIAPPVNRSEIPAAKTAFPGGAYRKFTLNCAEKNGLEFWTTDRVVSAWIHCRHQREFGRKSNAAGCPRDRHFSVFERLTVSPLIHLAQRHLLRLAQIFAEMCAKGSLTDVTAERRVRARRSGKWPRS